MWMTARDMTGERRGRLLVVCRTENTLQGRAQWICLCDCGTEVITDGTTLRRGMSQSCGCLQRELAAAVHTKHGLTKTVEYRAVQAAFTRCTNSNASGYSNYGGRGIEYRLPRNFGEATIALIAVIGQRPNGKSLDRIDNEGHYEIGNLRWATWSEQARNRRRNVRNAS